MERFVSFIAPKSKWDFSAKWLVLYLTINVVNVGAEVSVRGVDQFQFGFELILIGIVGGPFIALALLAFGHQYQLQQKLADLAATDMLTGLRNRRAFFSEATEAQANGTGGALLLLDADYFKRVNDSYGHTVGDICLSAIAQRIRQVVRAQDVIGRLGGEEFAVFLPGADPQIARDLGERLCEGVQLNTTHHGADLRLTLSAGATLVEADDNIERMVTLADTALYRAKDAGRSRLEFIDAT